MKASVLVVDDDPDLRRALEGRFRFWGHHVESVGDGAAALEAARRTHFDLVILDLQMPGMDGLSVLERLRPESADTEIVVLTAHGSVEKAVEAMRRGADDFLTKPADLEVVRRVVERALKRRRLQRAGRAVSAAECPAVNEPFVPITPNPYIVGNPVRDRSLFFGREAEFQLVKTQFGEAKHGGIIVFCGERRSGKTSILFQIRQGRLGPGFLPVFVDMQSMAIETEAEFYRKITSEIASALKDESPGSSVAWSPNDRTTAPTSPIEVPTFTRDATAPELFQEFVERLVRTFPGRKPILLIDEYELLEAKIESGALTPDVLNVFAALLEKHPFFLVFTGSRDLEERQRDYWRILGKSIHRQISYLDKSDAIALITTPLAGRIEYAEGIVEKLFHLGAGHPFYTQALCQSIVEQLNEHCTRRVTEEIVSTVVAGIVSNPYPQMLFAWEGLSRDSKLTLALLAEAVADERSFATADDLRKLHRRRQYGFAWNHAGVSTALEELFKNGLLLKHDDVRRGYAFRMDLWRRWIERAHSVWQVMREEGVTPVPPPVRRGLLVAATAVVLLVLAFVFGDDIVRLFRKDSAPGAAFLRPTLTLEPTPGDAFVFVAGESLGSGLQTLSLPADTTVAVEIRAPAYEDSTFDVRLPAGTHEVLRVALRPRVGALRVESDPSGALLFVDDIPRGETPQLVERLHAGQVHRIRVEKAGFSPQDREMAVVAGDTTSCLVRLDLTRFSVRILTTPAGARVSVAGQPPKPSPAEFGGLTAGRHRVLASHPGFQDVDSLVALSASDPIVHLLLTAAPPGILTILGTTLAQRVYLNGSYLNGGMYNFGPCTLSVGRHEVQIDLPDTTIVREIDIPAGRHVVFDYTRGEVVESK